MQFSNKVLCLFFNLKYSPLDCVNVIQDLIDLLHVSSAVHYWRFAFRAFFIRNKGIILFYFHVIVHSIDLKWVSTIQFNELWICLLFVPKKYVKDFIFRITCSTNFDAFLTAESNARMFTVKQFRARKWAWLSVARLRTFFSACGMFTLIIAFFHAQIARQHTVLRA